MNSFKKTFIFKIYNEQCKMNKCADFSKGFKFEKKLNLTFQMFAIHISQFDSILTHLMFTMSLLIK